MKIKTTLTLFLLLMLSTGCVQKNQSDELYRKAVVKLVSSEAKDFNINKNIVDYNNGNGK